jgi:hypothetical protein
MNEQKIKFIERVDLINEYQSNPSDLCSIYSDYQTNSPFNFIYISFLSLTLQWVHSENYTLYIQS